MSPKDESFPLRLASVTAAHEALLLQENRPLAAHNGIYQRW